MTTRRREPEPQSAAERAEQLRQQCRERVTDVATRLAAARAQVDAIYAELEQTVADTVPVLGPTAVQRLAGFKSRSSVTGIVDRFAKAKAAAAGPS